MNRTTFLKMLALLPFMPKPQSAEVLSHEVAAAKWSALAQATMRDEEWLVGLLDSLLPPPA